jgi:hypothetical protein
MFADARGFVVIGFRVLGCLLRTASACVEKELVMVTDAPRTV